MRTRFFYGWILVGIAWIIYGFGISPGYYSWGLFTPEIMADLGLTRADAGFVFGLFTFIYSGIGPITGMAISRWGARIVMTAGSLIAALGFYQLSSADSLLDCYLYYGIAGVGIGLSTILPCQTLATDWFIRYRARAVAIIFIAGGVVGRLVTRFDTWILAEHSWRDGWIVISGISLFLAVLAAVFIRDNPAQIGLRPDGDEGESNTTTEPSTAAAKGPSWSAGQAMKTPQFAFLCLSGVGYAMPWGIVVAHGRLHLEDLGFSTATAASVLGTMILVSIVGRLTGSLGDFIKPEKVLAIALALECLGVVGLLYATAAPLAYAATILVGLGFGAAYISIAVVFANFFGTAAFAKTAGTRFLITGVFNALGPGLAGRIFDSTGSYRTAFLGLIVICAAAAFATFRLKPPAPPQAAL